MQKNTDDLEKKDAPLKTQEEFLNRCLTERLSVSVYLTNGIKLRGCIAAFDNYAIFLAATTKQMIFKHSIATIVIEHAEKTTRYGLPAQEREPMIQQNRPPIRAR